MALNFNQSSSGPAYTGAPQSGLRNGMIFAGIGIILSVFLLVASFSHNARFRLVSSAPTSDQVTIVTPDITFNYNEPLASAAKATADADIIKSQRVEDKSLIITLKTPLVTRRNYTITVTNITSTGGGQIVNQLFTFAAADAQITDAPPEKEQAIRAPSRNNYNWINASELTDNGLTQDQLNVTEQAIFLYIQSTKQTVNDITFSKVVLAPAHPDTPTAPDVTSFVVNFNDKSYSCKLAASGISVARLYMYSNGTLVYDSKDINGYTLN